MLTVVDSTKYEEYKQELEIDENWQKRDFVTRVESYVNSSVLRVLIVSGLRGTGKTVGVLQAIQNKDAVYLLAHKGMNQTSSEEILEELKRRKEKIIVIDEYTWIAGYNQTYFSESILSLLFLDKRVILTGTESIPLEFLRVTDFIHRAIIVHTNHMSFEEYCRLFNKPMNKRSSEQFLQTGGIFDSYVFFNWETMTNYVKHAIISNLKSYVNREFNRVTDEELSTILYALIHKSIWQIINTHFRFNNLNDSAIETLDSIGVSIDTSDVNPKLVELVADVLDKAGILIRIPNLFQREDKLAGICVKNDYRTYLANPAIAFQFMKMIYPDETINLGLLFEANCMIELHYNKRESDNLYFVESNGATSFELDAVIVEDDDRVRKKFYLFECKHDYKINVHGKKWTILSDKIEEAVQTKWIGSEIVAKYVVHPGEASLQYSDNKQCVLVIGVGNQLRTYYDIEGNREICKKSSETTIIQSKAIYNNLDTF